MAEREQEVQQATGDAERAQNLLLRSRQAVLEALVARTKSEVGETVNENALLRLR